MESVSLFSPKAMDLILEDDEKYKKTPFLFLIASHSRNQTMEWASKNFKYLDKRKMGSWMIYCFEKN